MVDPEGGHEEESRFLAREVERRRGALREGALGAFDRIEGHWAQASEGLSLLRAMAPRLGHVIAESAEARFLLLENQADDANGWDIAHRDGITVAFGDSVLWQQQLPHLWVTILQVLTFFGKVLLL